MFPSAFFLCSTVSIIVQKHNTYFDEFSVLVETHTTDNWQSLDRSGSPFGCGGIFFGIIYFCWRRMGDLSVSNITERRRNGLWWGFHYNDVIMGANASQITSLTIVYSTVYSGAVQRKHQSSVSLAFVRGIHRGPVNSPHKWPVTRKMCPFDDVIMQDNLTSLSPLPLSALLPLFYRCYLHHQWHAIANDTITIIITIMIIIITIIIFIMIIINHCHHHYHHCCYDFYYCNYYHYYH